ncbi:MAG: porin family protein [Bacteroidetes bacterium]|nr:porin family protein [Bacteroidota bacterium]
MKKYIAFLFFFLLFYKGFAQESPGVKKEVNEGKDLLVFDLFTDLWQDAPSTAKVRPINQGVNIYVMLNFPIGTSNFSLAGGLGLSYHNFYSDAIPSIRDTNGIISGKTEYYKLNDYYKKPVDYSINKTAVSYLEIPVELKFKTRAERNKRFKASLGFKFGYNISNHTKYSGEDVIENTKDEITLKKSNIKYINNWTYGIIARLGYGKFNIMAYYSLSKLYEKNLGPQIYPISVGISITPF